MPAPPSPALPPGARPASARPARLALFDQPDATVLAGLDQLVRRQGRRRFWLAARDRNLHRERSDAISRCYKRRRDCFVAFALSRCRRITAPARPAGGTRAARSAAPNRAGSPTIAGSATNG